MSLAAIDLFCGAGALSRGLVQAGFTIVAAIDSWTPALQSYRANFPDHPALRADVVEFDKAGAHSAGLSLEKVDLLAGGPPCQGFSIQRIGDDRDDRNDLVLAFGRKINEFRPRMFLMENVPGLLGRRGKHIVQRFSRMVSDSGYAFQVSVIDAAAAGLPQTRRRVFFVGWLRQEVGEFQFPALPVSAGEYRTVREAIGDLPPPPEDFSAPESDPLHRRMRLSARNLERLKYIPPGGGFESLPVGLRVNCHKSGAARIGHRYVYGRLDPDRPAATITARFDSFTRGRFAHPWDDRNITLREGARLQGFPDDYVFIGTQEEIAAQIGNAIPPPLAFWLADAIRQNLTSGQHPISVRGQMPLPFDLPAITVAA